MSLVTIISINYNQPQVTLEFLESIKKNTDNNHIELILIDNGSIENQEDLFKKSYPDIIYIRSERNLGFAGGNNLGIQKAKGEFLLFLNNDTEITKNLINILISEFKQNPDIGLLSPLILYHEDKTKIQYAGFTPMNYLTGRNKNIAIKEKDTNQYQSHSIETGYIHGAAMMCRRNDLNITGLMDEDYFLYYEELDWCEKFKKAGKKIWFTGKTKIYHKESMSVGKESSLKTYFIYRNRMLFIRKNTNIINTFFFSLFYIVIACPKAALIYLFNGRKDLIPPIFKAISWNLTNPITNS